MIQMSFEKNEYPIVASESDKKRVQWIDGLRGFCIVLMVLGHNIQYGGGGTG